MKHLKRFETFYVNPDGELEMSDIRLNYMYEELWNDISDYVKQNTERWEKSGWGIHDYPNDKYNSSNDHVFKVSMIGEFDEQKYGVNHYLNNDEEAYALAKQKGFILDDDGIIIGFNGKKYLR